MKKNPYTLVFGKEPYQLLSGNLDSMKIIDDFESENSNHIFMLTGIRGSGKTVTMTSISKHFEQLKNWIVIDLTPDFDMIRFFAASLGESPKIKDHFKAEGISISLPGLQLNVKNSEPITDEKLAILDMLEIAKKKNINVLVTIDEAISNNDVKVFASLFQIMLRKDLPVYLLMTGLYENINLLQNQKTLTFLYRAPKIELKPLSLLSISKNYEKIFSVEKNQAMEMAKLTKGYPFAFQVLGYLTWSHDGDYKEIIDEYKEHLYQYVYEKLWFELSDKDKEIVNAIASAEQRTTEKIKAKLDLKQNEFSPYRKRLLDKGLIESTGHGKLDFTLPFFDEYVLEQSYE